MSRVEPTSSIEVLDALPFAVVLADGSGRITAWNDAAEILYGHVRGDVLGHQLAEVLFDADDRSSAASLLTAAAGGATWSGDRRIRRRDGVLLVSSFRATPVGTGAVAWIATDGMDQGLAEQERSVLLSAERAARDTAEEALGLVEAIVGSAPVGIAVFDLDLRYVRVNDAFAALSGMPAATHVGARAGEVLELPPAFGADLRRVVTTGRTILDRAIALDDAAGSRHFTISYYPVRTTTGVLVGAGATVVDVTEAKRSEAERASLLQRAETAQERLAVLATASTVLTTTMEVEELLSRLAGVLAPAAADWCVIQLHEADGSLEHVVVSHRDRDAADQLVGHLRASDGFAESVRAGQASRLTDGELERLCGPGLRGRPAPRSGVLVPIDWRGHVLGGLLLAGDDGRQTDDDDFDLAVEVAHRAALAISNARAFQQEHRIAESLQRALLPSSLPSVPGLELTVRYLAASDRASVGGDWYDAIDFGEGRVGIVIGDVVGHDIEATTMMGQLRNALRAYACEEHEHPARAVARLDRLVDSLRLSPATCVFGVLDTAAAELSWSNAGHLPPLLLRGGQATYLTDGLGVILGVTSGAGAREATVALEAGDVLMLYTDGLVERRGESLTTSLDRLARVAASLEVADSGDLCDAVLAELLPPSAVRDDDVALLVVRVRTGDETEATHRLDLPDDMSSPALARGFTAGVLARAGWSDAIDTAVLLVSELVTNAMRHGHPPCSLGIRFVDDATVELFVEDAGEQLPQPREAKELDQDGRGLLLVDVLAADWGIRPGTGGKQAWFRLTR